ncbi:MAG: lipopolysaccharide biosynthesis protein, partial [candidate division Zixibacteria bacterium]|nr:lipopolysaccharide biosynthesis protein [candidate division Zixibacteria bacterium]
MSETRSNNLWLFLEFVAKRRGLIVGVVVAATVVSIVVALLLPKWYRATVLLLPPKDVTTA